MDYVFELTDKRGKKIHLTKERWKHILEHQELTNYLDEIKKTIESPVKIEDYDEETAYYYSYLKDRNSEAKYILVIVKYLNGTGFVITSYFVKNIK